MWTREEKSWSPLLISGFWQYNIAYDISFCCKLYHLSEWMQEKLIRGHWGDLWALIVLQKVLKWLRNSNTSWYSELQNLISPVMTQIFIWYNLYETSPHYRAFGAARSAVIFLSPDCPVSGCQTVWVCVTELFLTRVSTQLTLLCKCVTK